MLELGLFDCYKYRWVWGAQEDIVRGYILKLGKKISEQTC